LESTAKRSEDRIDLPIGLIFGAGTGVLIGLLPGSLAGRRRD
jgi:hypothetical protein